MMTIRIGAGLAAIAVAAFASAAFAQAPPTAVNSIGMELVLIQPGEMQVGVFHPGCPTPPPPIAVAPAAPSGRVQDPRNRWTAEDYALCARLTAEARSDGFKVAISKPYYIGKYEVTQAQWRRVMGTNPSAFQGDKVDGDAANHPVDSITWADANRFVARLNALERTKAYRLPTEFEWEYACRAGGPGQQLWADVAEQANIGAGAFGASRAAMFRRPAGAPPAVGPAPTAAPNDGKKVSPLTVGSKRGNAWGVYDMLGNVWEWTADGYNGKTFPDPTPPGGGAEHVLKGGGFAADVKNAICATHGGGPGDGFDVGFRVVKDAD